jgi:outer membrane protein insertion porin family
VRTERALALALLLAAAPAGAQIPVDPLTEVRAIRFEGAHALSERKLRALLRTRDRGSAYGLRVALGKIPGVPSPGHHPFSPLVLQQDVVRIRQAYAGAGYFLTHVGYDVHRDEARNLLDITFRVEEGRPLVLTDVRVIGVDTTTVLDVPQGDRKSWARLRRSLLRQRGKPLAIGDATEGRDRLRSWWRDRGHPLAIAVLQPHADTARSVATLTYRVAPGPFARFGGIDVEGVHSLSPGTVRRLTPIDSGDAYSAAALERTRLALRQLPVIRVVNVDVPALAVADTSDTTHGAAADAIGAAPLPVRVQITEGERRVIGADLGYVTDGGIAAEANWEHRDFSGGGRSLNLTSTAQTGWLAVADNPDERYRVGLALRQPGFLARRLAAVLAPFVEYRNDTQDRSTQYGVNLSVVRQVSQFQSASLSYEIADRQIHEYRFGDLASGEIDLLTFLTQVAQGALDSLGSSVKSSTFTLSGITGTLDHAANPRLGIIVRPAIQVTAPNRWSSTSFWRADVSANAFLPVQRRITLAARGALGRLFPFGKSLPAPGEDPTQKFLELRDQMFTAGGTGDVRGWENRLLGPKVPDVRFTTEGDSLVTHADSYVPLGGLERMSFSVELQVPLPGMGPNFGAHFFLDGGRVATTDHRFDLQQGEHGQESVFYATGAGVDVRTPVGPIKMGMGYKLNPSLTDLVDPAELLRAAAEEKPLDALPRHQSRRWQFYLAIGASY